MTWDTLPDQGTNPWYTPFVTAWNNAKTYVDNLISTHETTYDHDAFLTAGDISSTSGVVLFGPDAPDNAIGSDGDWYRRSNVLGTMYRKISGTWQPRGAASNWVDYYGGVPAGWTFNARSISPSSSITQSQFLNLANTGVSNYGGAASPSFTLTNGTARNGFLGILIGSAVISIKTMPGGGQALRFGVGIDVGSVATNVPSVVVDSSGNGQVDAYFNTNIYTFPDTIVATDRFMFRVAAGGCFIVHSSATNVIKSSVFVPHSLFAPAVMVTNPLGFYAEGYGEVQFVNPFLGVDAL